MKNLEVICTHERLGIENNRFPGGRRLWICSDCAYYVIESNERGRIVGYKFGDNPSAIVGRSEGEHDFALIDERFLIDLWAKLWSGDTDQAIFDLQDPSDSMRVAELYGDQARWKTTDTYENAFG